MNSISQTRRIFASLRRIRAGGSRVPVKLPTWAGVRTSAISRSRRKSPGYAAVIRRHHGGSKSTASPTRDRLATIRAASRMLSPCPSGPR